MLKFKNEQKRLLALVQVSTGLTTNICLKKYIKVLDRIWDPSFKDSVEIERLECLLCEIYHVIDMEKDLVRYLPLAQ